MKIVVINNNIKINLEQIYALERLTNEAEIKEWENSYNGLLSDFSEDPPYLPIDEENIYKPEIGKSADSDTLKKYTDALNQHIIHIIGERPQLKEEFRVILSTGLKINVSQDIYNKIDETLTKFII